VRGTGAARHAQALARLAVMRGTVFFDNDGTLIDDVPDNVDAERICLRPGARTVVRRLSRAGFAIGIVSNQGGVAYGYFRGSDLIDVSGCLRQLCGSIALKPKRFFYCHQHPYGTVTPYNRNCHCRKPRPGLLREAARRLRVYLEDCWMVGDILDDVEAGHRAGCRAIFLNSGGETQWRIRRDRTPDFIAANLAACAAVILREP